MEEKILSRNKIGISNRTIRITKASIAKMCWFFLVIPFFKPAYFSTITVLDRLFDVAQILAFFIGLFVLVRKKQIRKLAMGTIVYYMYFFILTLVQGGDLYRITAQAASSIGVILVLYGAYYSIGDDVIDVVAKIIEILVAGNLISVILFPNGMYRFQNASGWWSDANWFLGLRNGMTSIYVMGFLIMVVLDEIQTTNRGRARRRIYVIVSTITILLINYSAVVKTSGRSAGAMIVCWGLVMVYCLWPRITGLMNIVLAVISNVALSIALVLFEVSRSFSYVIEQVFHKNTLRGRTMIWEAATRVIAQNAVFGVGFERGTIMSSRLMSKAAVATTHNGFLDVPYFGGVIGVVIVSLLFFSLCKEVISNKANLGKLYASIGYLFFVYLMTGQSESLISTRFFIVVTIIDIAVMCCTSNNETAIVE